MGKRKRKLYSVKGELLVKSREAALSAVQIFNNPLIHFKSETFIVLMIIAWTYLMHAYYRENKIDYRHFDQKGKRKRYHKTSKGAKKHWELERCLNEKTCPLKPAVKENLRFLIGLRHEIEHQMTNRIDYAISAKFQSTCLNFNRSIKEMFGDNYGIDKYLSFSLQFASISTDQQAQLLNQVDLPDNIQTYIHDFENDISDDIFNSPDFSYRVLYTQKLVNHKGQADTVIEFIKPDSELAEGINKQYVHIKEKEKTKYLPKQIVELLKKDFPKFTMTKHTELWKKENAKAPDKNYGTIVAGKAWYWFENWVQFVKEHCEQNKELYGGK